MSNFFEFAKESNEIERIYDEVRHCEHAAALEWFTDLKKITVEDLTKFVQEVEPEAFLRVKSNHRVYIGGREAPHALRAAALLDSLLININEARDETTPWDAHTFYEFIHPFIDGNGRSGRALWLWMMIRDHGHAHALKYPFLQWFYYQTLSKTASPALDAADYCSDLQKIKELISDFFKGDEAKMDLWMMTENYSLGGYTPAQMIAEGRADKLLKFIQNAQEENLWKGSPNL